MAKNLDLLGDPIPENWGKRGRPAHIPTEKNRNKIRVLLALGWTNKLIAAALRITQPTLREHYFSDLRHRDEAMPALKAARLHALYDNGVVKGNVGALKELGREIEKTELMPTRVRRTDSDESEKIGKKEAANRAAQSADEGTGWQEILH